MTKQENLIAYIIFGAGDLACVCPEPVHPEEALLAEHYRYSALTGDGSNEKILLRWCVPTCQPAA